MRSCLTPAPQSAAETIDLDHEEEIIVIDWDCYISSPVAKSFNPGPAVRTEAKLAWRFSLFQIACRYIIGSFSWEESSRCSKRSPQLPTSPYTWKFQDGKFVKGEHKSGRHKFDCCKWNHTVPSMLKLKLRLDILSLCFRIHFVPFSAQVLCQCHETGSVNWHLNICLRKEPASICSRQGICHNQRLLVFRHCSSHTSSRSYRVAISSHCQET